MNAYFLGVWVPLYFIGIIFAIATLIISFKVSKLYLYSMSIVLSLICIILIFVSIVVIRRWEGLAMSFITISSFVGIWIGTIIGMIIKK